MQGSRILSFSPSFNTYSSSRLTEIAARVVEDLRSESEIDYDGDDFYRHSEESVSVLEQSFDAKPKDQPRIEEEGEDGDFEFSFMSREPEISPISADEIFYNGKIKPVFPLSNTDLLLGDEGVRVESVLSLKPRRVSLGKLITEERDPPSCSSSKADELECLPPGKCKKSNSTGSSKRWRFRALLHRSNSNSKVERSVSSGDEKFAGIPKTKRVTGASETPTALVHEEHWARNRTMKDGDKRRLFLPYKQDLVGFFATVNGLNMNLNKHPF